MKKLSLTLTAAVLASTLATGCAPLIIGGAMVGGVSVATDRRTSGTQLEDETIEVKAGARIRERLGEKVHATVNSYNRVALVTGEATTEEARAALDGIVGGVENVSKVLNEVAIGPASSLSSRSNDVVIQGKVKAKLIDARDLLSNAFYIVVERGNVYLMGRVTEREADRATEIARQISGVNKVVKAFEIISEDELARYSKPPVQR
ncbi:BON domain-containing protein [Roseateles saccharophilus]|uniref:Osmotically-inducible protein OsmY n=1 Tax=Roseateles saccharophilus TaxID=304 RepID=A0A4R3VED9_ROSSA|nr:BON domain-containing protein [Roseateles saccharophilus]MDG0834385.1 BON domain-containing protein [Roseateles saccharophilus]TCV01989.1 osmotically-inducible protein OsmY [Roseateles saccharophilus]